MSVDCIWWFGGFFGVLLDVVVVVVLMDVMGFGSFGGRDGFWCIWWI